MDPLWIIAAFLFGAAAGRAGLPPLVGYLAAGFALNHFGVQGQVVASVRYEDEIELLKEAGIDTAYNLYEEAGLGFADHVCNYTGYCPLRQSDAGLSMQTGIGIDKIDRRG